MPPPEDGTERTEAGEERARPAPASDPRVVCHLIASNFAGGPEKQIVEHCRLLPRFGWRGVVGSFRETRPQVEVIDRARAGGLPTFLIETSSPFSPAAVSQLRRFLRRHGASVLVSHGYKSDVVGWLAVRRSIVQLPFVRGFTFEDRRVRLYEKVDRALLRRLARVLCVSEGTRQVLAGYGFDTRRIEVVHNAVDCARGAAARPVDLRSEFAIPPQAKVLVAAGRLSPEKGHRDLLAALAHIAAGDPPVCLVLVGSGREEEALRHQAQASGLAAHVRFAGFRTDALECLAGADLVVNPSLTEGLPNVVLEAFSVRTPVVATDVGGVRELVADGETGWLVPAGAPRALAVAISEALRAPERAAERAAKAWELAAARFSFDAQARRLVEVYEQALALRDGARSGSVAPVKGAETVGTCSETPEARA